MLPGEEVMGSENDDSFRSFVRDESGNVPRNIQRGIDSRSLVRIVYEHVQWANRINESVAFVYDQVKFWVHPGVDSQMQQDYARGWYDCIKQVDPKRRGMIKFPLQNPHV